jgi:tetratricopeptide (TPR) repeat protein
MRESNHRRFAIVLRDFAEDRLAWAGLLARIVLVISALQIPALASGSSADEVAKLSHQARAAVASEQWEAAAASYEEAIHLAPQNAALRVELGAVLTKLGRLPEAITMYQEALRIAPHNPPAEIGLAKAYRGVRNFEQAKRILVNCSREHPAAAEPLATMGDMEIQLQTYEVAITHLKAAVQLAPANSGNRNLLAAAYKAEGDAVNALAELEKVLVRDPENALAHYLQAEIYADRNQDDLALLGAQKVVELQPKNPRGRVLLGKILLRTRPGESPADVTKRCAAAASAIEPVAEGQANNSETLFLLSRAYRCAGQTEQADKTVQAFETASQKERTAREGEAQSRHLVQEANNAALKNDRARALDLAQQALAKNPNDGTAYSLLAKIYFSSGKIDEASAAITKALELDPYHPDFLYVQGRILQKQGKLDEALAAFVRTTMINPKESDAYFEIGNIYQLRSDRPRALAAYKNALELSPDDPDYRRALASVSGSKP